MLVGWKHIYTYVLLIAGFICLGVYAFIGRRAVYPLTSRSVFTGNLAWVLRYIAAGRPKLWNYHLLLLPVYGAR